MEACLSLRCVASIVASPGANGRFGGLPHQRVVGAVQGELFVVVPRCGELGARRRHRTALEHLKAENGRINVKSAPNRPTLSADRRRQHLAPTYAHAHPAQSGKHKENIAENLTYLDWHPHRDPLQGGDGPMKPQISTEPRPDSQVRSGRGARTLLL